MDGTDLDRRHVVQGMLLLSLIGFLPGGNLLADGSGTNINDTERAVLTLHGQQGPQRLDAELAISDEQRRQGLMDRESLAADAGMLFLYPQLVNGSFWMYRTRIPLDIAFIDEDGRIGEIHHMQPCESDVPGACSQTQPGVHYRAALEVNVGYFAAHGINVGDCVSWPGDGGQCEKGEKAG